MKAALQTGRHDRSDLHRHLETRLHPRYGESAVQVTSQCDVPAHEFPTFKLAAQQMLSRNSTHNAESARMVCGVLLGLSAHGMCGYGAVTGRVLAGRR